MKALSIVFGCAVSFPLGASLFWLLVLAIALSDDADKRKEREKCRKRRPDQPKGPTP